MRWDVKHSRKVLMTFLLCFSESDDECCLLLIFSRIEGGDVN